VSHHSRDGGFSDLPVVGPVFKKGQEMLSKKKSKKTTTKMEKKFPEKAEEKPERVTYAEPMQMGYKSDVGMIRSLDEDSIAVIDFSSFYDSRDVKKVFAVVADGMGGYSKGEVASYLATKTISENILPLLLEKRVEGKDFEEALRESFRKANEKIMDHALGHPECVGMGTTASAAVIDGAQLYVGHVGDTRVYVIKNKITQITKDHSLVQELLDKEEITPEEARNHPQKNVITRAIGVGSKLEVDVFRKTLEEGDYVLLCCDGLVNEVEDQEIMCIVLDSERLQDACDGLVNLANKRGGRDNISVVVVGPIKVPEAEEEMEEGPPTHPIVSALEHELVLDIGSEEGGRARKWCPSCGHPNEPSAEHCSSCGAELEE
jgi:serine/threonine protein phosphatase PrpC